MKTIVETHVTYALEQDGEFVLIEQVPARVCRETGEQYFSPETVEHIQALITSKSKPDSDRDPGLQVFVSDAGQSLCFGLTNRRASPLDCGRASGVALDVAEASTFEPTTRKYIGSVKADLPLHVILWTAIRISSH